MPKDDLKRKSAIVNEKNSKYLFENIFIFYLLREKENFSCGNLAQQR
jgi:hypothetical protein